MLWMEAPYLGFTQKMVTTALERKKTNKQNNNKKTRNSRRLHCGCRATNQRHAAARQRGSDANLPKPPTAHRRFGGLPARLLGTARNKMAPPRTIRTHDLEPGPKDKDTATLFHEQELIHHSCNA